MITISLGLYSISSVFENCCSLRHSRTCFNVSFPLILICYSFNSFQGFCISDAPICPANLESKCSDSVEWKGKFFPDILEIKYESPSSKNPLEYKWYNVEEEILGKTIKDWLRFSVVFWHTFCGNGGDTFSAPTKSWPWEDGMNSVWCFHDRDIAPDETNVNLDEVMALAKELQIKPLWGKTQLFMHPCYM
ncbi:hypothetical protein UlMin_018215 [Ulmus minor]